MAQVTDLYSKLVSFANSLSNKELSEEVLLISELYRKALEMNAGYNQVNRALSAALSNIDDLADEGTVDADELESVEEILNEASKDLRQRAKSANPNINESNILKSLKDVRDNFNQAAIHEELANQPQVYETGRAGKEVGHYMKPVSAVDNSQKYINEAERYQDLLANDPKLSINVKDSKQKAANQNIRAAMMDMIKNLVNLSAQANKVQKLSDDSKNMPNDQETKVAYEKSLTDLQDLRAKRNSLKQKINKFLKNKELDKLTEQFSNSRNPIEKNWLQEQIELLKLRLSGDLKLGNEIKARQDLINALGVLDEKDNFQSQKISPEILKKLQENIELGKNSKLNRKEYDRQGSLVKAKEQGKVDLAPSRNNKGRGGGVKGIKLNDYNLELATFNGLVDKLNDKINTATHVARLEITQEKDKTHNDLKPYVDALSKAIQKKDNKAKYDAIKELKKQTAQWMAKAPAIKALEKNVRLLPYFKQYKNDFQQIGKWQTENGWDLNEERIQFISNTINKANKLKEIYNKFYHKENKPELFYTSALEQMDKLIERLKKDVIAEETNAA